MGETTITREAYRMIVRAVEDYTARSKFEVSFVQGDRLQIIEDIDESGKNIWWQARNMRSLDEGYIPTRLVTVDNDDSCKMKKLVQKSLKRSTRRSKVKTLPGRDVRTDSLYTDATYNYQTRSLPSGSQIVAAEPVNLIYSDCAFWEYLSTGQMFVKAKQDYWAKSSQEVNFREGDKLVIIEDFRESENKKWLQARNLRNHEVGYVPADYVISKEQTTEKVTQKKYEDKRDKGNASTTESVSNTDGDIVMKALYTYTPIKDDDLAFMKGDRLLIIEEYKEDEDQNWYSARNLRTLAEGLIPKNYVVREDGSLDMHEWYFDDVDREVACKRLLSSKLPHGTFLIRKSSDNKYALSVRVWNQARKADIVKHYRIHIKESGEVFIMFHRVFNTLAQLVEHYRNAADGLCAQLTTVCPKVTATVEGMEVTRESIILDKKIGSGQYSDVWQGKLKDKLDVAVKTLKPGRMEGSEFLIEAKILLILRHANILKLLAVCTKTEPFYVVTELMKNGSLLDYLRDDYRRKEFTFSNIIFIISQIASGMTHFERSNYIHRDLAARNILVGERNIVKIGDLTTAKEADSGEDGKRFYLGREGEKLPVKWTAPECYMSKCWKTSSDVWSFGIVLYEIITFGSIPYPGMTNREVVTSVPEGYRMTKPAMQMMKDHDSTILFNIAMSCWKESPEKRPTFEYLKEFFYNYKQS